MLKKGVEKGDLPRLFFCRKRTVLMLKPTFLGHWQQFRRFRIATRIQKIEFQPCKVQETYFKVGWDRCFHQLFCGGQKKSRRESRKEFILNCSVHAAPPLSSWYCSHLETSRRISMIESLQRQTKSRFLPFLKKPCAGATAIFVARLDP